MSKKSFRYFRLGVVLCSPKKKVSALGPEVGEDNALDNVLHDNTADPYAVAASDDKMPPSFLLLEPVCKEFVEKTI